MLIDSRFRNDALPRLARAAVMTALVDFTFSSVLVTAFYRATFASLWQRVASTLLGPTAIGGGTRTVLIGIAMHICVATLWSTVFLVVYLASVRLRHAVETTSGMFAVASVYGPCIWLFMSFLLIPRFTGTPPTVTNRWWVQFFGHILFVAVPIVIGVRGFRRP